jgi:uncharacterized protein (TIGR02118 family)
MLKFVALWNLAPDVSEAEFERWYRDTHIADARRIPGLRRYTVNRAARPGDAATRYYRMAELSFDSYDAAQVALASPEWQHAFRDASGRIADHLRLFFCTEDIQLDG